VDVARKFGNVAMATGLFIGGIGLGTDMSTKGFLVAAMLVVIGTGLRLEGALLDRHG
jgi:hypothetical protein